MRGVKAYVRGRVRGTRLRVNAYVMVRVKMYVIVRGKQGGGEGIREGVGEGGREGDEGVRERVRVKVEVKRRTLREGEGGREGVYMEMGVRVRVKAAAPTSSPSNCAISISEHKNCGLTHRHKHCLRYLTTRHLLRNQSVCEGEGGGVTSEGERLRVV